MLEFKIPEIGENITSGTVVSINVAEGDQVKKDQDLFELETDKASLPVPSPCDGIIKEILVKEGDEVAIGAVAVKIEEASGNVQAEEPAEQTTEQPEAESEPATVQGEKDTHTVVIGGGPGGYTAAFHSADLGLKTALVEINPNPGGVCLYKGCIPSKALLHAAKIISESQEAKEIGIDLGEPKIDLDKLRSWKEKVVTQLTGGLGQLTKKRNVQYIQGRATFVDSNTIEITKEDGTKENLTFEKAILATGSEPIFIPSWPKSERIIDSTGALALKDIPQTMLVIGGGVIGMELGSVYAQLGASIDVVEMLPHIIPGADKDIVSVLEKRFKTLFNSIMLETKVTSMEETSTGIKVKFENKAGEASEKEYERVLVSIGRKPNSANIGLENTKVEIDERGFVKANAQQLTTDPSIFAIGDLIGQPMLAHKASHEGIVAAEVIAGKKAAFEPKVIPGVVYTDPEVAWCGLTEIEAREKDIAYEVVKFPWAASGRAISQARTDGLTKLLIDPKTELILGMAIVGIGAGELIAEGVVAIEMGATATDLKMSIHPHPTISETIMESAESFFGHATHIYRPKKK